MTDIVDPKTRSRMMSGIRGKDTRPELLIRRALHSKGFRFRLHQNHLPGKPDLVFPKWNAVVFINGCFWHLHDCHLFRWPSTRKDFWRQKIECNKRKDEENLHALEDADWRILIIWECALKGKTRLDFAEVISLAENWLRSTEKRMIIRGSDGTS